jgi:adenylyltransferase/sulfurtransferase
MSQDINFSFLNTDEQERYQKHLSLKEIGYEGQISLKKSSVLCIGAGGLGSSVLLYLAAAGIGKIGIIDNDHVEKSNLQRQIIHETNTVGNLKIDSARERIKKLNPNCELLTFSERINPKNALEIIQKFDVICDCSDNFATRYLINDSCLIQNKPLIFGSVQGFEGQVSVFNLHKNSPNLRDLLPESPSKNSVPSCAEFGVVGVSTGLIGILQVNEIIKIILKKGETLDGKILVFDLLKMNMKKLHLKSDPFNKRIKNLSQFEDFYSSDEYCEKNNEIKRINASDFKRLYQSKPNRILLIDVRENEEFSDSALEGSISLPLSHLNQKPDLEFIRKESLIKEVFTICKTGKRSEKASIILSQFNIQSRSIAGGLEKVKKIICD